MKRVLEKEIMDDKEESEAYLKADILFEDVYTDFVKGLTKKYRSYIKEVVDLGCGTAQIPVIIARTFKKSKITCVDASKPMIALAFKNARKHNLLDRLYFVNSKISDLEPKQKYDLIISDGVLHHMHNPTIFWDSIKRLAKDESAVYIKDLFRPSSKEKARGIVERVAFDQEEIFKKDFYNSLLAAFSLKEIRKQLLEAGLKLKVEKVSERHVIIHGIINKHY